MQRMQYSIGIKILCNLLLAHTVHAEIAIWNQERLPLEMFTIVKKIPVQTVYKADSFYLKIWNQNALQFQHRRYEDFLNAVLQGVFDGIAPLVAIVMNDVNQCCGYATEICQLIHTSTATIRNRPLHTLTDKESLMILQLFKRMRKKTLETGYCFTDLASVNLGILNGTCYFFDLDGFWSLDLYKRTHPDWQSALFYLDKKYE